LELQKSKVEEDKEVEEIVHKERLSNPIGQDEEGIALIHMRMDHHTSMNH